MKISNEEVEDDVITTFKMADYMSVTVGISVTNTIFEVVFSLLVVASAINLHNLGSA